MNRWRRVSLCVIWLVASTTPVVAAPGQSQLFDPRVLTPSNDVVTPHIAWCKPVAAGPLRVLFVVEQLRLREVIEFAQRADLDWKVFTVPSGRYAFSVAPLTKADFRRDFSEKLAANPDLLVVGVDSWEKRLSLWQRYQLLKAVKAGLPMLTLGSSVDGYLTRAAGQLRPIDAAFPVAYEELPAFKAYESPTAFSQGTFQVSPFGAGRIGLLYGYNVAPPQMLTPIRPEESTSVNSMEYEAYTGFLLQVFRYLSGREPLIRLRAAPQLHVSGEGEVTAGFCAVSGKAADIDVRFEVRDADSRILQSARSRCRLQAGETQLTFPLEPLYSGDFFCCVWLENGDGVIDFGTRSLVVDRGVQVGDVQIQASYGMQEPVTGSVGIASGVGRVARLRVCRRDNLERLTGRIELPITGPDPVTFSLPPSDALTIIQFLDLELLDSEGSVLACQRVKYSIDDLPTSEDIRYVIWGIGSMSAKSYLAVHALEALRGAGFDTHYTSFNDSVPLAGLRHIPYAVRLHPDEEKARKLDMPHVRVPCTTSPEYREELAEKLQERARLTGPFSTCEFSMGDECHFGFSRFREICYSDTCLAAYREFLRREYGGITELNTALRTNYASLDDVIPPKLAEAREHPELRPLWIDFRRHMDSTWANLQAYCRDVIRAVVPDARTGYEGTDYDNHSSFDAFDLWKVMKEIDLNNTYDGAFCTYAVADFAKPGSLIGTGWMGSYADYKKYNHWPSKAYNVYIPWRHLFRGANSFWVWYACLGDRGLGHGSIMAPDFSLFDCFVPNCREVREIKQGLGKLLMHTQREDGGTAILYSISSQHAATVAQMHGLFGNNLRSLVPLMEDTRYSFRIISYEQLAEGILSSGGFKRLILPFCQALSRKEVQAIREFVADGGTVLADLRPGVCDEHGIPCNGGGALDDVFGVRQETSLRELSKAAPAVTIEGKQFALPETYVDNQLVATTSHVGGACGDAPACMMNSHGNGKAVLLNFSFEQYQRKAGVLAIEVEQLQESAPILRDAFSALMTGISASPTVAIRPEIPSLRAYRYISGSVHYVGLLQHPVRARAQAIEKLGDDAEVDTNLFAPPLAPVSVALQSAGHVYDVRRGVYLGKTDSVDVSMAAGRAELFGILPYRVEQVALSGPDHVCAGDRLALRAEVLASAGSSPGDHVLRVTVIGPAGDEKTHYSQNVLAPAGVAAIHFPTALDDERGLWTIAVRDVATGTVGRKEVTMEAAK